jgi:hypothetical protein
MLNIEKRNQERKLQLVERNQRCTRIKILNSTVKMKEAHRQSIIDKKISRNQHDSISSKDFQTKRYLVE